MVVSSSCCPRPYARSALPMTNGARVIDSTPPAIARPISPVLIARAAWPTASRPEAHRRLIVTPDTAAGRPANSRLMRATLRLSSGLVGAAVEQLLDRDRKSTRLHS